MYYYHSGVPPPRGCANVKEKMRTGISLLPLLFLYIQIYYRRRFVIVFFFVVHGFFLLFNNIFEMITEILKMLPFRFGSLGEFHLAPVENKAEKIPRTRR